MLLQAADGIGSAELSCAYALYALRSFHRDQRPSVLPDKLQEELVELLHALAPGMDPCLRMPALGLPWVASLRPQVLPSERVPHLSVPLEGRVRTSIFTFSPFEARRELEEVMRNAQRVLWVSGEAIRAIVVLSNPLAVPISVQHLSLVASITAPLAVQAAAPSIARTTATPGTPATPTTPSDRPSSSTHVTVTAPIEAAADAIATSTPLASPVPLPHVPLFTAISAPPLTLPPRSSGVEVELTGHIGAIDNASCSEGWQGWQLQLRGVRARSFGVECVHPINEAGGAVSLSPPLSREEAPEEAMRRLPPPLCVTLATELPFLVVDKQALQACAHRHIFRGEVASLSLRLLSCGSTAVRHLTVDLESASAKRLTSLTKFVWYEMQPLQLFDESEDDNLAVRDHVAIEPCSALDAQLPLHVGRQLTIPLSVSACTSDCAFNINLEYGAVGGLDGVRYVGSWFRKLVVPVELTIGRGLSLSHSVVVLPDMQPDLQGGGGVGGCVVLVEVSNEHERTSFELSVVRLDPSDGGQVITSRCIIAPRAGQRLLVPVDLFALETDATPHPFPRSKSMLDTYISEHQPKLTEEEARLLRQKHLAKARLLAAARLQWRAVGSEAHGRLPMSKLTLTQEQATALLQPVIRLEAHLEDAHPPQGALPHRHAPHPAPGALPNCICSYDARGTPRLPSSSLAFPRHLSPSLVISRLPSSHLASPRLV